MPAAINATTVPAKRPRRLARIERLEASRVCMLSATELLIVVQSRLLLPCGVTSPAQIAAERALDDLPMGTFTPTIIRGE